MESSWKIFYKTLKEFGADRQALDATRILRIPGSINPKTHTEVKIIDNYDYLYELREIQNEYMPELSEKALKKRGRPKNVYLSIGKEVFTTRGYRT